MALLALMHGIAHLPGFFVPWRFLNSPEMPFRTTVLGGRLDLGETGIQAYGLLYLLLCLAFSPLAWGVFTRAWWWPPLLLAVVAVSLVCCFADWPLTRWGVAANAVLLLLYSLTSIFPGDSLPARNKVLEDLWRTSNRGLRLQMKGEIKLQNWLPFVAEQIITQDGQFVWAASLSMFGLPLRGADMLVAGHGRMDWRLLEFFPVLAAAGEDITRSARGRVEGEMLLWLPEFLSAAERADPKFVIERNEAGEPVSVRYPRWGNPDNQGFRLCEFFVLLGETKTFAGCKLPARIRAGWMREGQDFSQGEFFRATISGAEFR